MNQSFPSHVGVIGLGYVGLTVATAFGRILPTVGFDIDSGRVEQLKKGNDRNGEVSKGELEAEQLIFTTLLEDLVKADVFIVAVPTSVDTSKRPDLSHLKAASHLVGKAIKIRNKLQIKSGAFTKPLVIYESTSYPGCTEDICIPVIERESGLKACDGFEIGYSPERINPGDPEHTLSNVVKVVAAQNTETTDIMARVYGMIVHAGIYKAPDIRTAEAAKAIENVQRDLNIALMNELSMLFNHTGIQTNEVLKAARTKWNFLPFHPGLVGGHCIPVDPYYLTHWAEEMGHQPKVILAGREINDSMSEYVAQQIVTLIQKSGTPIENSKALILGVTFKEDVRDVRNSQTIELARKLERLNIQVYVYDPLLRLDELEQMGLKVVEDPFKADARYEALILAVPHGVFRKKRLENYYALLNCSNNPSTLVDLKGTLDWDPQTFPNVYYWRL